MTCVRRWASEVTTPGQRCVRVRTDVAAVPKLFDYLVPDGWTHDVRVGTRVRVELHGRRVGGWVVDDDVTPPEGVELRPLKLWSGWGPPPALVELAKWAAWRWAGPISFFLGVASPHGAVRRLPGVPAVPAVPGDRAATNAGTEARPSALGILAGTVLAPEGSTMLRVPPTTDLIDLVLAVVDDPETASRPGGILVVVPSLGWAERLCARLVRRGYRATTDWAEARAGWPIVVGSRAAAWAPLPRLAAALVLDAHDESFREESAPTYSAIDVITERARRDGCPCVLTSPCPPVVTSSGRALKGLAVNEERAGWATIENVDRRGADPRSGMFSEEFVALARSVLDDPGAIAQRGPVVCFYDRTGRARILACSHCGELAQCTTCGAAMAQTETGLRCPRCLSERPLVCASCGRMRMKTLRAGVTRLREEVAALLGVEVGEVSGSSTGADLPAAPVLIGTEAILHRVRRASAVVFLDIDLHLLAPRFSATDETLALLVRASRLVGPRRGPASARVLVQTRVPDHPVLVAVARGEPAGILASEESMRQSAGLPPFSALAAVSGSLANGYVEALRQACAHGGVTFSELAEGRFLVQAPGHVELCDLLAGVPRPPGRGLRVEVDPAAL
jgi:primosomal protein N' (replication factor Y) (superfamily II helicase)